MPRILLLVSGSPELGDSLDAKLWVREVIERRVAGLPAASVLLAGGGAGPEAWSIELASARGLRWVELSRSGVRRQRGKAATRWAPRPVGSVEHRQALIEAASRSRAAGWTVVVLGLLLRGVLADGRAELLTLAREASLRTDRLLWPPQSTREPPRAAPMRITVHKPHVDAVEPVPEGEEPRWLQVLRRQKT